MSVSVCSLCLFTLAAHFQGPGPPGDISEPSLTEGPLTESSGGLPHFPLRHRQAPPSHPLFFSYYLLLFLSSLPWSVLLSVELSPVTASASAPASAPVPSPQSQPRLISRLSDSGPSGHSDPIGLWCHSRNVQSLTPLSPIDGQSCDPLLVQAGMLGSFGP